MGSGRFSVYKIYLPLYGRAILTSDRSIHDAGNIRNTFCNSQVFPVNLAVCHHPGEQRRTVSMFGKNQKTGRIPVQTVDAAVDKGFAFLTEIPGGCIGKGILVVPLRRVNRHVGGLVDDEQIFIFIDDWKRQWSWNNMVGGLFFHQTN